MAEGAYATVTLERRVKIDAPFGMHSAPAGRGPLGGRVPSTSRGSVLGYSHCALSVRVPPDPVFPHSKVSFPYLSIRRFNRSILFPPISAK